MQKTIKSLLNKLPYIKGLYHHTNQFNTNACYPAGHYYSPIVSVDDIEKRQDDIWKTNQADDIKGINLNSKGQIELINNLATFYGEFPFSGNKKGNLRYQFDNDLYSYTDGIVLYSMMRFLKPKRIIEVGSGHTSALMLDVNELFFDNQIELTFIEPYTERLFSLLSEKDKKCTKIIEKPVQNIDLSLFEELEKGDILFIDSTHVAKCGSDVNFLIFEVLPCLKSGVFIHIHDMFFPFEYPKNWVLGGRNWNEDYFIKAFLMYNSAFEIKLFAHYLHTHHTEAFKNMPLAYQNFGGNLWLEKL